MKLYTQPSIRLKGMPFLLMLIGLVLITAAQIVFTPDMLNHAVGQAGLELLAIDFYGLVLNFAILLNLRGIEQRFSYSASLIVYFVYQLSRLADSYVFHGKVPTLVILRHLLPVVYYTLSLLTLVRMGARASSVDFPVLDYRWTDQLVQQTPF